MSAYLLLTLTAFAGQAALVIPIVPLLVSAGALAARGELHPVFAVAALVAGLVPGDYLWYRLGRSRGGKILSRVCRAALEPNSCVRKTQNILSRYGAKTLLVAKFIPGLSTVALPMAGVYGMRTRRFFLFDGIGVLVWCTAYVAAGYISVRQLANLAPGTFSVSSRTIALIVLAAVIYVAWKYLMRRRRVRQIWTDRITADELRRRLAVDPSLRIVDLRHALDFEADPYTIPGALYIPAEELARRYREIPRRAEVVLYCTCPDEATSAREAFRLRARGVRRVRPLIGGFNSWRDADYPVEFRGPAVPPDERILNAA